MTLPLKANHLIVKKKNTLEGVMTHLILTPQGLQNTKAEWMMKDNVKEDNGMTPSKVYAHESIYYKFKYMHQTACINNLFKSGETTLSLM